jgi:hypothetical protein
VKRRENKFGWYRYTERIGEPKKAKNKFMDIN